MGTYSQTYFPPKYCHIQQYVVCYNKYTYYHKGSAYWHGWWKNGELIRQESSIAIGGYSSSDALSVGMSATEVAQVVRDNISSIFSDLGTVYTYGPDFIGLTRYKEYTSYIADGGFVWPTEWHVEEICPPYTPISDGGANYS